MFYADSLGFINLPGKLPRINFFSLMPELNLVHLTSAPPFSRENGKPLLMEEVLREHEEFVKILNEQKCFEIIRSITDIEKLVKTNNYDHRKTGVVLGLQNPPDDILENNNMKVLYNEGIRIMTIAYECENPFGGGCMARYSPLTKNGKKLLDSYAENEIIFDFSHAGFRTARETFEYIYMTKEALFLSVMASHSGLKDIYEHPRNINDQIADFIYKRDGIIGIPTLTFILDEADNTLNGFMRHIKEVVYKYGQDNVCVGSDGVYKHCLDHKFEKFHKNMFDNIKYQDMWKVRFPEHPVELNDRGKMFTIAKKLMEFYSEKVVEKICGLNFLNFLLRNLPSK